MPYNNTPIAPSQEVSGQVSLPLARVQKIINADPERLHTSKNGAFAIALATEMFIQHLATTTHNVVKAERKPRRNIQYRDVATAVAKTDNLEFLVDVVPKTMTFREFKRKQEEKEKEKEKKGKPVAGAAAAAATENPPIPAMQPPVSTPTPAPAAPLTALLNGTSLPQHSFPVQTNGHPSTTTAATATTPIRGPIAVSAPVSAAPEAMDIDNKAEDVASEPEQDSPAKQLEMEMRGPRLNGSPSVNVSAGASSNATASATASPSVVRRPSGFTAINGTK